MLYILVAVLMIALDQAVKYWALTSLQAQQTIPLLDGVFHLTYVENRGAAFSMFAQFDSRWIFVTLAVVITAAIVVVLHKKLMQHAIGRWSLVLVAAGAVGNAIDRVVHGFVVDLFDFRLIHFPVFNVADIFICVGGALFVIYFLFLHKDEAEMAAADKAEGQSAMNEIELTVPADCAGLRVDSWLAEQIDGLTRSAVQNLLAEQAVCCDGKPLKKNYKLAGGECLVVTLPELREVDLVPENIPLDVVYEDHDMIVVNKPRGMVVHPAPGNWSGTLVNALMYHCGDSLSGINGEHRPGIVHRIDKDTSGLLVVAKNDAAHQSLAAQIAAHTAFRGYQAIVVGCPREDTGTIDKPIARHKTDRKKMAITEGGREAITHYTVLRRYHGYTHMAFRLETGRTHQIRVHMASIGHPIIGDPVYGLKKDRFADIGGQCLHAAELTLCHPVTGEQMHFSAPLPDYFTQILEKLEKMA